MDNNFNQEQQTYQNDQQTYQGYSQYQQPMQQPMQQVYDAPETEEPVTFGDWMLTKLILCIPIVNLVMMFVWAFGNGKKSKSNFFKAELIWVLIQIVFSIIMMIVFFGFFAAVASNMSYY